MLFLMPIGRKTLAVLVWIFVIVMAYIRYEVSVVDAASAAYTKAHYCADGRLKTPDAPCLPRRSTD